MKDIELDIKETKTNQKTPTATGIFFKATLLSLVFTIILLLITGLGIAGFAYYKFSAFTKAAQTSNHDLLQLIETGIKTQPKQTNGYKTILLLGLDSVTNKPGSPLLTDTIMLISINLNSGEIRTESLPRDLWSDNYKTRINALYHYGQEKYPLKPEQFPEEVIGQLINVNIDHTIVLSLEQVSQIIDLLGGIKIDVPEGFTDTQFPREDINIDTAKTEELYETISFDKGLQYMDGKTVLKYIRSRKSSDLSQGTDVARATRQQQVISALIQRMTNFSIIKNTDTLAKLYKFYTDQFESSFSKQEAISTIYTLLPYKDKVSFSTHTPSIFPENPQGIITNPPLYKYKGEWIYEIRNLEKFQEEIQSSLQGTKK